MAISAKVERDTLRQQMFDEIVRILSESDSELIDDVMIVKSNKFCFPCIGCNGTELYTEVTVSVPTGSKDEPYNGYERAQDYVFTLEEKKRKQTEREAEKKAKQDKKSSE